MKLLVIGGGGMLGHKLVQILRYKFDVYTTFRNGFRKYEPFEIFEDYKSIENIDVENLTLVEDVIFNIKPDVIINAVGIIKQLPSAKNVIKTLTINSIFPHQLAELANQIQARLITISTDCVFNGKKGKYIETDFPDADDLYGKSKDLGEVTFDNCLTIRTSIIGRELFTAHSLIEWFLSNRGRTVKGYINAVYSGLPTVILAEIIGDLIDNYPNLQGLYHISSEPINKYDLLNLVNEAYGAEIEIEPFEDFVIDRSLDSTRFRKITGFQPLNWREMINKMASDDAPYSKRK